MGGTAIEAGRRQARGSPNGVDTSDDDIVVIVVVATAVANAAATATTAAVR